MNYQTFSNLQFRKLLKTSFHIVHIDLKEKSGENIPFVSAGIIRLVLMFGKASNIRFYPKRRYMIVPSRQVEIPFYGGIGRQHGRGFSVLAQGFGRTELPFLRKYIVRISKHVGADLMEFAAPEIAQVVSGGKNFKTAANSVGIKTLRKELGSDGRKRTASRVFLTKSAKQTSWSRSDISTDIS